MRIAAIYHNQGNFHALEAVLAEIQQNAVNMVVVDSHVVPGPKRPKLWSSCEVSKYKLSLSAVSNKQNGVTVPDSLVFISNQTVYWDMLDLLGVLHNARYVIMFERSRFDFWSHLGVGPEAPGFDWPYVVARNEVDYRSAIRTEQKVTVTVSIREIRNSSATFEHTVVDESGVVSAKGTTTLVRVDAVTYRPIAWSENFRDMVRPYVRC